ncbi:hypothetical protein CDL12_12077 [Handroanthus impetiginosus]|uniref:Transcriptional coactivator Hfi1/Transcriptional adapter 1 n=1 Tax=Handroanthus impetiginosus TaxID=429701 RepID=A0A2G9HCM3_9LAMI|nr:hypothetical protein CDL12_12077 [Handroanthus impetiginosus]
MVANHHFTRVDMLELKDLIYQKIGHQRAEKYFDQLKRFFSLKLSKIDFEKNCIQTIGRENIFLHNKLIRSIIRNASNAKVPPQKARKVEGLNVKVANGYPRNYLQSLYGDAFPQSPRKCRSPVNRKFRDRQSPLGPLGKSPSTTCEETVTRIQESATELHSLCSRPPVGVASVEDGEEVEQFSVRRWSDVSAPLGVKVNSRKGIHCGYPCETFGETCESRGELPDTGSLRGRLEKKLALDGVGISMDCANVLNNGLDVFLKRLIEPCVGLAGSRCRDLGTRSNGKRLEQRRTQPTAVSLLDFRVAMESNPHLLGEDWSVQLEKICQYAA